MNHNLELTTEFTNTRAALLPDAPVHKPWAQRLVRLGALLLLTPIVLFALYTLLTNLFWRGLAVGELAPELAGRDLHGNIVRLSDYHGQAVMLTFWSPDCFACREELPTLQAIAADPTGEVALVTVVSHLAPAAVAKFAQEQGLTFPILVDEAGAIPNLYAVSGIPFTYLIGSDGRIEQSVIGAGEPGALQNTIQTWRPTCRIDAPCTAEIE